MIKILIVIASYGSKNDPYLQKLIDEYRRMDFQTDIVVLSNVVKDLGQGIELKVGLPSRNPWSLPFGHKKIFAQRTDEYDLFIYSEDDILITERNINAVLEVSRILPDNEIAGFLRYEIDQNGKKYYSTVHSHFHWDPGSVKTINGHTFAHFTNEHSGCYILTQDQLKRAIISGRFIVEPWEGYYDMLCTAATDPYTQSGFKKMICISRLNDFCLPHLSNAYIGKIGTESSEVLIQITALKEIVIGRRSSCQLFNPCPRLTYPLWNKKFYEPCRNDIIKMIPEQVKCLLSIGCGSGATEAELVKKGIRVVAIPLDEVIGSCAEAKGIELVTPDFEIARHELSENQFDCLLISNVLQYLENPIEILKKFSELLAEQGFIVIGVPNFAHVSVWGKRFFGKPIYRDFKYIGNYEKSGLHFTTFRKAKRWLREARMKTLLVDGGEIHLTTSRKEVRWLQDGGSIVLREMRKAFERVKRKSYVLSRLFDGLFSSKILLLAQKTGKDKN